MLLIGWALFTFDLWRNRGFFDWLGIDFGFFYAGARAFVATGPTSTYDLSALAAHLEPLSAYFGLKAEPLKVGPVPYPPIFVLLVTPLTLFSPDMAFLLWTLANLILAIIVVRGLASRFQNTSWVTVPLILTFFPLAYSLMVGQVTIILLFAIYHAYRHLERTQDFQAGLWAGILLLKPQYAVCLILVLLVKQRWSALGGIGVAGAAITLSSVALLGLEGFVSFYSSLRYAAGFREVDLIVYPDHMIGWRGLLVNLLPGISEAQGMALTLILSAITIIVLLIIWRGPWNPRGEQFAARMFATVAVSLLVSYHSHIPGGSLLIVPGLAMLATTGSAYLNRVLAWGFLLAPPIIFFSTRMVSATAAVLTVLMVIALFAILANHAPDSRKGLSVAVAWRPSNLLRLFNRPSIGVSGSSQIEH